MLAAISPSDYDAMKRGNLRLTIAHLSHGFTPTDTCPPKNFNGRCLGYVVFECSCKLSYRLGMLLRLWCMGGWDSFMWPKPSSSHIHKAPSLHV